MIKRILLPLDGSALAESALPATIYLAEKLKAQVTLLHVIEKNAPASIHGQRHLTTEPEACNYLAEVQEKYFPRMVSVERHVHTEEITRVAQSIVEHSSEFQPDLIVMCAHGEGGVRDFVVGSIAQQVIAMGESPVLLLQPEGIGYHEKVEFTNFLVALDGNPEHESGFDFSVDLARTLSASIHLTQVVPTLSTLKPQHSATGTLLPVATNALLDMEEENAVEYLEEKIKHLSTFGITASAEVQRGDPAGQVVQSATEHHSQLIILGTHGKSGLSAFWAGSVAPKIVEQTALPILLVPVRR